MLPVTDVARSAGFWDSVGLRDIHRGDDIAIFELRGGTHLILFPNPSGISPGDAPFDLMVDDLVATHADWAAKGLEPSAIAHDEIHDSFTVRDPDGYVVTVNNSHVAGPV